MDAVHNVRGGEYTVFTAAGKTSRSISTLEEYEAVAREGLQMPKLPVRQAFEERARLTAAV